MNSIHGDVGKRTVSVSEFLEAGREKLGLELVAGKAGLKRHIIEPAVNRPGLALTGFFQYFAHRRIQVFGHAEHAYLASLDDITRCQRIRAVFEMHIPCVVVTRHRKVLAEITNLGEEHRVPILKSPLITGNLVNIATIIMEDLQAPSVTAHGTMVEILGIGVLIVGLPGIGKSETALSLIKKGHSLVADDVTQLRRDSSGAVMGSAMEATRYHMEVRGLGIIHVPSLFGVASVLGQKKLDLVVTLESRQPGSRDDLEIGKQATVDVLGAQIPSVLMPVAPGRDLAGLIEVAALDMKLKAMGHDAAKELDDKLIASMSKGETGRE